MTELSSTPPLKFFKHLNIHKVEELLDIWNGLQQSAVDNAIDGERTLSPA